MTSSFDGFIPSYSIFQKLRLILSTYQDGSGQLRVSEDNTLPGWRDFERAVAIAFQGKTQESKSIFDVLVPDRTSPSQYYGISCKMRGTLNETLRNGYVSLELSNSSKQFWDAINHYNLNQQTYREQPAVVGKALVERVKHWHDLVSTLSGGNIVLSKSFFLTLSWDRHSGDYQLHQFKHELPDPADLVWSFPLKKQKGELVPGKRIIGQKDEHILLEWYGESGGQLKYYPLTKDATWQSELFKLEPLPNQGDLQPVIMTKIYSYFPGLWTQIQDELS
ncbi:MAG: hypothetical protein U0350_51515 [Caldilineaceae bacterium]